MLDYRHPSLLERYQRVLDITRDLASTLDLDTLLDHIVHAAKDLCAAEAASILLYDEAKNQLFFQAASNLETPLMRGLSVPVGSSIAGWILTQRQPLIIADTKKDPRHFEKIGEATSVETNSLIGVPLIHKERVIGVLEVINKLSGSFENEDLELLDALGAQAAVTIENTRLFQQSDLISELVHELRTPLGSLNAAAYLLLRQEISQEQRNQMIQTMIQETHRLSEMATSFLDFARLESGRVRYKMKEVFLSEIIASCRAVMDAKLKEKNHQIKIMIPEDMPPVIGDPDKLMQVFINLLSNAIKFTPTDGSISIAGRVDNSNVIISINDNGPGIPAENLNKLFERFYRVPNLEGQTQGTGLGLSICKRIINAHQGEIVIQSAVGEGTSIEVTLPTTISIA